MYYNCLCKGYSFKLDTVSRHSCAESVYAKGGSGKRQENTNDRMMWSFSKSR